MGRSGSILLHGQLSLSGLRFMPSPGRLLLDFKLNFNGFRNCAFLLIALNPSPGTATPSLCQPTAAQVSEVAAGAPAASSAPSNDGSGNVASSDIDGGRALVGDILDDVGSAAFSATGTRCYH